MTGQKTPTLNTQQEKVVRDLDNHLLVLAPAGTGKTNTIAQRIIHIVEAGRAEPEEILCLSFTNRACREMAGRVENALGEDGKRVSVRTIHSFCYNLLREYGGVAGENHRAAVICDDEDALEIVKDLLARRKITEYSPRTVHSLLDYAKHFLYGKSSGDAKAAVAQAFQERGGHIRSVICTQAGGKPWGELADFLEREGGALLGEYNGRLAVENAYDFTDLLIHTKRLADNPAVAELLARRYRYIHIDEVQDTSAVEYDLLTGMLGKGVLVLCGDDNQTIYQWRGSAPDLVLKRFCREFHAQTIRFTKNYRSSPGLLSLAERYLAGAAGGEQPPAAYSESDVELREFQNPREQALWIYETAKALGREGNYSDIAVLGRSNSICNTIAEYFGRHQRETGDKGLRCMLIGEMKLLRKKEIKDILAFVRVALNDRDGTSLRRVMQSYSKGIGAATLDGVARGWSEHGGAVLADFISDATQESGDYFGPLADALEAGRVVVFDVESTGLNVYADNIVQIAAVRVDSRGEERSRFERFLRPARPVGDSRLVHGFDDDFLRREGRDPKAVLEEFLEYSRGMVVVGHNVGYDKSILTWELRRHGLPEPRWAGVYDTLDLARRFVPGTNNHKLATLAEYFGTEHAPTHNAMDDILATAEILVRMYREYLEPYSAERRAFYETWLPRFAVASGSFKLLREKAAELNTGELVEYIAHRCGVRKRYREQPERVENIGAFVRFAGDELFRGPNPEENLSRLLEFSALSTSELDRLNRDSKKMAIITIHQAKGCEFDYVFLPSLTEYSFPSYIAVERDSMEEEKRLFYVALTRARKKVFLSWCRTNGATDRTLTRSRFLDWI